MNAIIAVLFAATFAAALAVRAWKNTNRILAERALEARLRAAGANAVRDMDAVDKALLRARLVTAATRTPIQDHCAAPDQAIPYELTDKALQFSMREIDDRPTAPRCRRYFYRPGGHR